MMREKRIFVETEFLNRGAGHPLHLISLGMVDDAGNEFYAINAEVPLGALAMDQFIVDHVWPHLPLAPFEWRGLAGSILEWDPTNSQSEHLMELYELREKARAFLGGDWVELWGDYCAFDMVLLSQLFGPFKDVPGNLPMMMNDLQQLRRILSETVWHDMRQAVEKEPPLIEHHALVDAWAVKHQYDWLMKPTKPVANQKLIDEEIEAHLSARGVTDYDNVYSDGMVP
jgi:hypothetical protein